MMLMDWSSAVNVSCSGGNAARVCRTGPEMEEDQDQSCFHIVLQGGDEEQVEPGGPETTSRSHVGGFDM